MTKDSSGSQWLAALIWSAVKGESFRWVVNRTSSGRLAVAGAVSESGNLLKASALAWGKVFRNLSSYSNIERYKDQRRTLVDAWGEVFLWQLSRLSKYSPAASSYDVGAVLSHTLPDGSERPVTYASRTLNAAECNYSQIEKEGLSCVFGVKPYLFGRRFTLITDHKSSTDVWGCNAQVDCQTSEAL